MSKYGIEYGCCENGGITTVWVEGKAGAEQIKSVQVQLFDQLGQHPVIPAPVPMNPQGNNRFEEQFQLTATHATIEVHFTDDHVSNPQQFHCDCQSHGKA